MIGFAGGRLKAYEVVAARLRSEILEGARPPGARLSNEMVLAEEFGVSRATIREALRLLGAENLIRTAKGAGGGSFVARLSFSSATSTSVRTPGGANHDGSSEKTAPASGASKTSACRLADCPAIHSASATRAHPAVKTA